MVILSVKTIIERYIIDELCGNILISTSKTGYNNDKLSMDWLLHYDRCTRLNRIDRWRMLIFDGFGSHLVFDFIEYCWNNDIISLCLPPYIIYFIQSFDIILF
jgi:hypothetical protein